jgi:uncharacterized membrane protein
MIIEPALLKALVALVAISFVLAASAIKYARERKFAAGLQVVGASCLVIVVLTHVCEALDLLPSMHWGEQQTWGHYLDLASAIIGLILLPLGYLLRAVTGRRKTCDGTEAAP